MLKYQKIPYKSKEGVEGFRYLKDSKLTKEARIPHSVMEKFEFTDTVEYDDAPDQRKCLFCDAPKSRIRPLNGQIVELCEWHYQNMNLGKIAAQVELVKREKVAEPKTEAKKKHKYTKTALSSMV